MDLPMQISTYTTGLNPWVHRQGISGPDCTDIHLHSVLEFETYKVD